MKRLRPISFEVSSCPHSEVLLGMQDQTRYNTRNKDNAIFATFEIEGPVSSIVRPMRNTILQDLIIHQEDE